MENFNKTLVEKLYRHGGPEPDETISFRQHFLQLEMFQTEVELDMNLAVSVDLSSINR